VFRRVLVPVKATRGSERAIEVASELACQLAGDVHLVTVDFEGSHDMLTRDMLEKTVGLCRKKGVNATFSILSAKSQEDVTTEIARASDGYDLIVMGHCRYKKIYKFLHYSVAEDLIKKASCPVVVAAADCPEKAAFG